MTPIRLANPFFLALKAGLATLVALLLGAALGNPDMVSATFVSVLCVSPTVLLGLRRGVGQLAGSTLGGLLGAGAVAAQAPLMIGVPLAVGGAVWGAFLLRLPSGYAVAAFTALFVQILPANTIGVRLEAVLIGGAAGFAVNVLVSGLLYHQIYDRRLRVLRQTVAKLLHKAAVEGPFAVQPGFAQIAALEGDLRVAREELRWRRVDAEPLEALAREVAHHRQLLHLIFDLGYALEELGAPSESVTPFLSWLVEREGPQPPVPPAIAASTGRILAALLRGSYPSPR